MPSRANFQVVSFFAEIIHHITFTFIPIKYNKISGQYIVSKNGTLKPLAFVFIQLASLALITIQLISSIVDENRYLTQFLFNGLVFFITGSTAALGLGYHLRAKELCYMLNCMVGNPRGFINRDPHQVRRGDDLLLLLTVSTQISMVIQFVIFIPLLDMFLTMKCQNYSTFFKYIFGSCETTELRYLLPLSKVPILVNSFVVGSFNASICFVSLKELVDNVKDLSSMLNRKLNENRLLIDNSKVIFYRRMQVFGTIFNECFQTYNLTVVEFIGCMMSICLGCTLILDNHLLHIWGKIATILFFTVVIFFIIFEMDVGSKSIVISTKIICHANKMFAQNDCKWGRKCIKSCPPVALSIGSFHKISRQRGPDLIRYILQRTIFLVLKSKEM